MSNAPSFAAPSRLQNGLMLGLVIAAACLPMLPSLNYELVWDDRTAIGPILDTNGIADWLAIWASPFDTVLRPGEEGAGYYRPGIVTTLILDRALYGDWLPGYHLTNIAWYAATCAFLWLFLREFTGNTITATLAALVYAVHPVHAESVCLITGRVDSVAGAIYIAALWLAARGPADGNSTRWHLAPALVLTLGMFSKEVALLGAPVVALVSWLRMRDSGLPAAVRAAAPIAIAGLFTLAVRFSIPGLSLGREDATAATSIINEILTGFGALGNYTRWLLTATGLAARHEMPAFQGMDLKTGVGIVSFAALIIGTTIGVAQRAKWSVAPALVATTLLPLSWSPLLSSIGVAERLLYVPSAAIAVLIALLPLRTSIAISLVAFIGFSAVLPGRVAVWRDQTTLFESMLRDEGNSSYLHSVLAVEYTRQQDLANAIRHLKSARELDPNDTNSLQYMIDLLAERGQFAEALPLAQSWVSADPGAARAWFLLGAIQLQLEDLDGSTEAYLRAVDLAPERAAVHLGLATVLAARGELYKALDRLEHAERLDPEAAGAAAFRRQLEQEIAESPSR